MSAPKIQGLIIIGFMGTGKTSVGRALAARLGLTFIDLDAEVERAAGRTIPEIFAAEGEAGFRRLEAEAVKTAAAAGPAVISTGGGVVLNPDNVANLRRAGHLVLLEAPPDEILRRVQEEGGRPLLAVEDPLARIIELLEQREPHYRAAADLAVTAGGRPPEMVADEIIDRLRLEE